MAKTVREALGDVPRETSRRRWPTVAIWLVVAALLAASFLLAGRLVTALGELSELRLKHSLDRGHVAEVVAAPPGSVRRIWVQMPTGTLTASKSKRLRAYVVVEEEDVP